MCKRKFLFLFIAVALCSTPVVANAQEPDTPGIVIGSEDVIPDNTVDESQNTLNNENNSDPDNSEVIVFSDNQEDQVNYVETPGEFPEGLTEENLTEGSATLFSAQDNETSPATEVQAAPENDSIGQSDDQPSDVTVDSQIAQNQLYYTGFEAGSAEQGQPEFSIAVPADMQNEIFVEGTAEAQGDNVNPVGDGTVVQGEVANPVLDGAAIQGESVNPAADGTAVQSENAAINPDPVSFESALPTDSNPADNSVTTASTAGPLDQLLEWPTNFYNQELAEVAAELSNKAYSANGTEVVSYLKDMGFQEENISTYNYDGSYAYTLATKEYTGADSDGNTDILVMDARGSVTVKELISDAITTASYDYLGQKVYGVVDTFFKEIEKNVSKIIDETKNYKILATGHSLGGAVANLFSAVMTQNPKNQVYGYTFGAIDSIASDKPVEKGYENIHNIYNDYDTFSPSQYGNILVNGAGSKYGKFGHVDDYSEDHRTDKQKDQYAITQIYNHVNHEMKYYVADVKDKKVECEYAPGGNDDDADKKDKQDDPRKDIIPVNNEPSDNVPPTVTETTDTVYEEPYMDTEQYENIEIKGDVSDSNESFSEFAEQYAISTGSTVLYSLKTAQAEGKYLIISSVTTIKDADGHVYVTIDVHNASNETITIGLNSVSVNGNKISVAPWRSEPVHPGKHVIITVPVDGIASQSDNAALALHVYGTDGKEKMTTSLINIFKN